GAKRAVPQHGEHADGIVARQLHNEGRGQQRHQNGSEPERGAPPHRQPRPRLQDESPPHRNRRDAHPAITSRPAIIKPIACTSASAVSTVPMTRPSKSTAMRSDSFSSSSKSSDMSKTPVPPSRSRH